jgi:hypothetical protein
LYRLCKYICSIATPLVFRRINLVSPRLCPKLRSTPAELSSTLKKIGQHVRDVDVRPSDLSEASGIEVDVALAAALKEMRNLRTLTIIYDPLDTRRHTPLLELLRQFKQLEHITLAEPPRYDWARGFPVRVGHHETTSQTGDAGVDSNTESESESGSERGPDTDAEAEMGPVRRLGSARNLHSFRNLCLATILQHHAPRLLSVRLHGSIPLDDRNYRLLRDTARNIKLLELVGAFESCSSRLVAEFKEETPWACAGKLRDLSIRGSNLSAISEARVMHQFNLGVFGDALDKPPSVHFGESCPRRPPRIETAQYDIGEYDGQIVSDLCLVGLVDDRVWPTSIMLCECYDLS